MRVSLVGAPLAAPFLQMAAPFLQMAAPFLQMAASYFSSSPRLGRGLG